MKVAVGLRHPKAPAIAVVSAMILIAVTWLTPLPHMMKTALYVLASAVSWYYGTVGFIRDLHGFSAKIPTSARRRT